MVAIPLKTVIGALAVSALLFNTYYAYIIIGGNGSGGGWLGGSGGGGDGDLGDLTVKVPEFKIIELSRFEAQPYSGGYRRSRPSVAQAAPLEAAPDAE